MVYLNYDTLAQKVQDLQSERASSNGLLLQRRKMAFADNKGQTQT